MNKLVLVGGVAATALAVAGWAGPVLAQSTSDTQLPEIVVTASKTGPTALQKTPLAVYAFTSNEVEKLNIISAKDLVGLDPSLQISQNGGFSEIYIRGIGSNNVFNGADPSVTVQVDGVYIARPYSQVSNFLDVERVEVLNGPQGTLYGRNAIGGTINVISQLPDDTFHAKLEVSGGNYDFGDFEGAVSGPIIPGKIDASLSASYVGHSAFLHNVTPGGADEDNENQSSIRAQVLVHLSDRVTAITRVDGSLEDDTLGQGSAPLNTYDAITNSILGSYSQVANNTPDHQRITAAGISEEIDFAISPAFNLKSLTAIRSDDIKSTTDADNTDSTLLITNIGENEHEYTQEFDANGKVGRLTYVGGFYFIRETDQTDNLVEQYIAGLNEAYLPKMIDTAWAVFAQGDYAITDRLKLTVGVRYTEESKTFNQDLQHTGITSGVTAEGFPVIYNATHDYSALTPKAELSYTLSDVMLYVSATRGFKSGGFNMTSSYAGQGFGPETVWSYEAGLKSDLFDHTLRFNLTGFYYDYTNLQVQAEIIPGVADITNAASAHNKGLEFGTIWEPIPRLQLSANATLLDARYSNYVDNGVNYSGNYLNEAPPYTVDLMASYTWLLWNGGVTANMQYNAFGRVYFVASNLPIDSQGDYGLLAASIGYQPSHANWRVSLWGKNLTDTGYYTTIGAVGPVTAGHPGDPRTFGIKIAWSM